MKIGTDILVQLPNDGLQGKYVNAKAFVYSKFVSLDADENLIVNWMFYDGKEALTLAKDVLETAASESAAASEATAADEKPSVEEPARAT